MQILIGAEMLDMIKMILEHSFQQWDAVRQMDMILTQKVLIKEILKVL